MQFVGLPTPSQALPEVCVAFFLTGINLGFLSVLLFKMSPGGMKSQRQQDEHETRHLTVSAFPFSLQSSLG